MASGPRAPGVSWSGLLIAVSLAALAGCSQKPAAQRAPEPGDRAVATVDGQPVWASDVRREAVAQGAIGEGEPLDVSSDLFRQMLDEVVDEKLLAAEAVRRRMDKDPIAQRRLAAARDRILGDMLVQSMVDKAVTEQSIQALYQQQLKHSKLSDEIHARQIVVATAADAQAVRRQLASGASFEALARQRSIDPATRSNGGDLGYFTADLAPGPYGEVLKDAKPGQVFGPIKVDNGFAVVQVEDRRPEQPVPLDQARPQIVRFLTYDEVRDLIKRLRDRSRVQFLVPPGADAPGAPPNPSPRSAASSGASR